MAVKSESVTIYEPDSLQGGPETKDLVEALGDVAKARSTRELIRDSQQRLVKCALRVPLLKGSHPVQPAELGRALRKAVRSAVDAASPGDHVLVDFVVVSSTCLEVRAGPNGEMGGPDGSVIDSSIATDWRLSACYGGDPCGW